MSIAFDNCAIQGWVGGIVSMNASKTPEFNIQIEEKNQAVQRGGAEVEGEEGWEER